MGSLKLFGQLFFRFMIGVALVFLCNMVLSFWNIGIPNNLVTTSIAGGLGAPGVALLFALKFVIGII